MERHSERIGPETLRAVKQSVGEAFYEGDRQLEERTIYTPEHLVAEHDIEYLSLKRNDLKNVIVVQVHRPPEGDTFWREDLYCVFPDGRTAYARIEIDYTEEEIESVEAYRDAVLVWENCLGVLADEGLANEQEESAWVKAMLEQVHELIDKLAEAVKQKDSAQSATEHLRARNQEVTLQQELQELERSSLRPASGFYETEVYYQHASLNLFRCYKNVIDQHFGSLQRVMDVTTEVFKGLEANEHYSLGEVEAWQLLRVLDKCADY